MPDADLPDLLTLAGAGPADLAWFEAIGWDPARVPPAEPDTRNHYARRLDLLAATMKGETFAERGGSPAGQMAAAIGARLADLREEEEKTGEDEED